MPAGRTGLLDNIRYSNGPDGLREYFGKMLQNNRLKAIELINDSDIQFSTIYLLREEISGSIEPEALNPLYYKALKTAEKLQAKNPKAVEKELRTADDDTRSVLKWIIKTGNPERCSDHDYLKLLENAAALLVKSFRDTSVLPEIADMIFSANRDGKAVHDLVWAFFEASRPESLYIIAGYLNSPHSRDVELAKKLLCFIPDIENASDVSGPALYNRVILWLQENLPYLYYTGESMYLCNSPRYYEVSYTAKYLLRPVSAENGEPLSPLNGLEKQLASSFDMLTEPLRRQLSDFSQMLYKRNPLQWSTWIRLPLNEQARMAAYITGGLV